MNPFYFGASDRPIFGIHDPAAASIAAKRGAVLCHPWGAEYLHAHRSMRQLAIRLSAAGFHTLRFDFFGTGDSAGEMAEADLAGWEDNVEDAVEELKNIAGVSQVTLIGLRLGATLAARAAAKFPRDIGALVLWDPILSGDAYLRDLGVRPGTGVSHETLEIHGFPLTPSLLRDFNEIDIADLISTLPMRRLLVMTDTVTSDLRHAQGDKEEGGLMVERLQSMRPWIEEAETAGVVPVEVIQRIVDFVA
jgi:pimeloyl-ACP methyl ester carboxylesterase